MGEGKILVTGATGFLGSHIVRKLLERGNSVRILRRKNSNLKLLEGLAVEEVIGDVTDRDSVFRAVQGCEAVFHTAANLSFWGAKKEVQYKVNVDGTQNVVEACLANRVKRLIHTSSISAIGFATNGQLGDESLPYNWGPLHINYCDTKNQAEQEIYRGIRKGLGAVILNPAVIFGPGNINFNGGTMIYKLAKGQIRYYLAGGCCTCDVDDVTDGHIAALERGKSGERYILGGQNFSWKELFDFISKRIGVPAPQRKAPTPLLKMTAYTADFWGRITGKKPFVTPEGIRVASVPAFYSSDKAVRELGYAITPFEKTIEKTYRWYKENNYL